MKLPALALNAWWPDVKGQGKQAEAEGRIEGAENTKLMRKGERGLSYCFLLNCALYITIDTPFR